MMYVLPLGRRGSPRGSFRVMQEPQRALPSVSLPHPHTLCLVTIARPSESALMLQWLFHAHCPWCLERMHVRFLAWQSFRCALCHETTKLSRAPFEAAPKHHRGASLHHSAHL